MSRIERKQDGYQPIYKGYQPSEDDNKPIDSNIPQMIIPPQGGTGEVTPSDSESDE
jgi:hypothetical protein